MATPPTDFVHLHVHTMYSLLDGAIRLDRLFDRAKQFGMHSVAITDHGTMFNVLEFYQKAVKAGIKPIIGCECYVAPRTMADKTPMDAKALTHLVLLAENQEGYRNLCRLATMAQTEGFYYKPRIDKAALQAHHAGLIALSACLHGEIPQLILQGRMAEADQAALAFQTLFGEGNFFLEVQNNGIDKQDTVNGALREMSARLGIPLVASNDCHYLDKDDVRAHDVLLCVQTGKTVDDAERFRFRTDQLYFKSKEEMIDYFRDFPGAIENSVAIAGRCDIAFDLENYHFPQFTDDSGLDAEKLFVRKTEEGFERVWRIIQSKNPDADPATYRERLAYEMGVINRMGFPGYFLIVADFINYAKGNNIPVGPGRGSAAGSLVAYALGITDLDPLEHGLIFERFLNPDRISMPDIDVDFCINGRDTVFKYVVERYGGWDYVAQIITFGKLKTRAVIRDVGRALAIPLSEVDAIAKLVPDVLNISLDDALKQEPQLRELQSTRPEVAELIDICRVLEGLPRHASTHAAGVVIGDKPLVHYLPLYKGKKGEVVTQFDMKLVENIGLVKFDFLGLRNLTVIDQALKLIRQQDKEPPDLSKLDFDDAATYALLSVGDTTGVFQLESSGMKDLLVRMKPECFADVTALVALYRPGPLDSGMVDDFVERKHGRKTVEYMLPELAPILEETYGVIVYQEQVMKIASALASYTMAEADGLRKAMGKKNVAMMAEHRERFVKGAVANGHDEKKALALFDLMEKFGGYGFNKSHSAAYALIAYQTAFLKAHFPLEFIAALLTSEMHSIDGVVKYINECRTHQIEVLPPDVNRGDTVFTVADGKILFGLVAVKNVGEGAVEAIVAEREANGPYKSLFDFCERVDLRKVNKRVVEALIACGAFAATGAARSQMMAVLEEALEYGQKVQKERCDPQLGLFDEGPSCGLSITPPTLPKIPEWPDRERLAREKESLGFFISGHPLAPHQNTMAKFAGVTTATLDEVENGQMVRMGGMVAGSKLIRTKKDEPMAFVQLEDLEGSVEVVVFPSVFGECRHLLTDDRPLLVQGKAQKDEKGAKILADTIIAMEDAESLWTAEVHFTVDVNLSDKEALHRLREVVRRFPGDCRGFLHLRMDDNVETVIAMDEGWRFQPGDALRREVAALFGYPAMETRCAPIQATVNGNGNGNGRRRPNGRAAH
ncbi:DNA polymerase III subunit alpha [Desulfatitalea alkaliphila]|uniref:DNA polymerase III subunit alpha n=1 Tax=Desulfatitalea alkaliphila TaxID=2929485 RepID=A0AA41R8F1_9BACT|nr:DNA polymerase III subunit alpha [Desulfatitalea alkaliphila]MCJ8500798.1 DNA polymerase III subunit alpha [Desulfatitalea alkaliphila]